MAFNPHGLSFWLGVRDRSSYSSAKAESSMAAGGRDSHSETGASDPYAIKLSRAKVELKAKVAELNSVALKAKHASSDVDTTATTKSSIMIMPFLMVADHVDRVRRAVGVSTILPSHRSPAASGYPKGTRGARLSACRASYCKLSEGDRERIRLEHEQASLADELRFLGVYRGR